MNLLQIGLNGQTRFQHRFSNDSILILGDFDRYGCDSLKRNLIRVNSELHVDADFEIAEPRGIRCLAQDEISKDLFLGGRLSGRISNLRKFSAMKAHADFAPRFDGVIEKLSVLHAKLFVEGQFLSVNSNPAERKAVLDLNGNFLPQETQSFINETKSLEVHENQKINHAASKEELRAQLTESLNIPIDGFFAGFDDYFYLWGSFIGVGGLTCPGALIINSKSEVTQNFMLTELQEADAVAVRSMAGGAVQLGFEKDNLCWIVELNADAKIDKIQSDSVNGYAYGQGVAFNWKDRGFQTLRP